MAQKNSVLGVAALGLIGLGLVPSACGSSSPGTTFDSGASGPTSGGIDGDSGSGGGIDLGGGSSAGPGKPACTGLQCQQKACANGASTTLKGRVLDPSGTVPIYNAVVYVPNAPVEPMARGLSCDRCGTTPSGSPIASALTDAKGDFVLRNAPAGTAIPLVVQVGRWRRQVTVASVAECGETALDPATTRLPRNRKEGDLPQIAISTGGADSLECFLRKLGIDDAEFTLPSGAGAVHLYKGEAGSSMDKSPDATELWGSFSSLAKYDMVILSCEGNEYNGSKSDDARKALRDYLDGGGRVFASHFHYTWFKNGADPLPTTASWVGNDFDGDKTVSIDTSFAKGQAFAEWMVNVGASKSAGSFDATDLRRNAKGVPAQGAPPETSRRWVYWPNKGTDFTKYFSFNTPIGAAPEKQCGRGVYTDIHVSGTPLGGQKFPAFCKQAPFDQPMTPQEKALLFLLMDLASCIQDESQPPRPPQIPN